MNISTISRPARHRDFHERGFTVLPGLLSAQDLQELPSHCEAACDGAGPGRRDLLSCDWARALAASLRQQAPLSELLPPHAVAVQCSYFRKNANENWLVPLHRDTSIPVKRQIDDPAWRGWSIKDGIQFAKPPTSLLRELVAVRLHFEDNSAENGALQVIPGSHKPSWSGGSRVVCEVPRGSALIMRPLLLHASSKLHSGQRRVLHFLFAPPTLPEPAEWADSV